MEEAVVELWMVGLALAALLVLSARDVGRPGRASAEGLLALRLIGGAGLGATAALALASGSPTAALVAGRGAVPLLSGLVVPLMRRQRAAVAVAPRETTVVADPRYAAPVAEERRAA